MPEPSPRPASLDPRPIARLRRLFAAVRDRQHPAPDDRAWFLAGMRRFEAACLAEAAPSLERSLGLDRQGARAWWHSDARERRDLLLVELRAKHFADLSSAAAATSIASLARRAASRAGRPAPGPPDGPAAMMAAVLASGEAMPGLKQLSRILGRGTSTPRPGIPCPNVPQHRG